MAHAAHLGGFVAGAAIALGLLVTRQVNTRGSDILSAALEPKAWKIIGKPNQCKDPQPIEAVAAEVVSMN